MVTDNPTSVVGVLRVHLVEIQDALDGARGYHLAQDLADSYRSARTTAKRSPLASSVERALAHVEGYLTEEPDDE